MKILITTDVFPPRCGGSGWSTYHLAKALQERGHDVDIIKPFPGAKGIAFRKYNYLEITEFGNPRTRIPLLKNYYANEYFYKKFSAFLKGIAENYDVIHAQHQMTIPPSVSAGRKCDVPVVSTVRDYWPVCYFGTLYHNGMCSRCDFHCIKVAFPINRIARFYAKRNIKIKQRSLRESGCVISVSRFVKNAIKGVAQSVVVPNLVDTNALKKYKKTPAPDEPYMLFVGKLNESKGAMMLMESLKTAGAGMKTVIIGEGVLSQQMAEYAARNDIDIKFTGYISNNDMLSLMAHAEFLLFPSLWPEPLSRVLLESAVLGIPAVATNTGGTPEIVTARSGVLTKPDAASFSDGIRKMLSSKRSAMGRAAKKAVTKRFDKKVVIKKIEKIYSQVSV